MSHKIKQKLYLPNVQEMGFDGKEVDDGLTVTASASVTKEDKIKFINHVRLSVDALSITVTDTDDTTGGYGSKQLCVLPDTHMLILGAASNLSFTEAAAGISDTAAIKHSVGTAAEATNDTLDSTQANIIPSTSGTLVDSAVANVMGENTGVVIVDASSGTAGLFLNLGIADAGISASGAVVVTGYVDIFYIDLGNAA